MTQGGQPERRYFDIRYQYDLYGNLSQHEKSWQPQNQSTYRWARETFTYDLLHRLRETIRTHGIGAAGTGPSSLGQESYDYTPNGNLSHKSDYASNYIYEANQVRSVEPVDNGPTQRYEYDLNGNLQRVYIDGGIGGHTDRKVLNYDPYNKPLLIDDKLSGHTLEFAYGSNDQRFIQLKDGSGDYTIYIDKLFEANGESGNPNTDLEAKLYIGDYAVYDLSLTGNADGPAKAELNYLHRDRLGSVVAMSSSQGAVINMSGRGFDAFGKPREEDWQNSDHSNGTNEPGDLNRNDLSTRGFTGHEHLNETDLIHMNGRVYDYNLGRFLSVDPFIQFPANSQSMNAYSYIMNNPLSGTDPSGYAVNSAIQECRASSGGCGVSVGQNANLSGRLLDGLGTSALAHNGTNGNGVSSASTAGDDMTSAEGKLAPESRSSQNNDDSAKDDSIGNDDKSVDGTGSGNTMIDVSSERNSRNSDTLAKADSHLLGGSAKGLSGIVKMDGFTTNDAARKAAAEDYVPAALFGYREVGWVITTYTGASGNAMYAYTYPTPTIPGDQEGAVARVETVDRNNVGHTVVERGHNHFTGELRFSAADARLVEQKAPLILYDINGNASKLTYRGVSKHIGRGAKRELNNAIKGIPLPNSKISTIYK